MVFEQDFWFFKFSSLRNLALWPPSRYTSRAHPFARAVENWSSWQACVFAASTQNTNVFEKGRVTCVHICKEYAASPMTASGFTKRPSDPSDLIALATYLGNGALLADLEYVALGFYRSTLFRSLLCSMLSFFLALWLCVWCRMTQRLHCH